ncbi:TOMM precursor leader peptide-binding protein [Actinoalloteichus spitiensis]|uniref:TOMM precursor leader peptide-binding protein n=1 Tax=Actinoalloteichus spitiensis TaxID=252394 RepID=UPI0009FC8403|nr:TOMM precursor leader peptide-binding protein [Actinoalloteichus spitiensis]
MTAHGAPGRGTPAASVLGRGPLARWVAAHLGVARSTSTPTCDASDAADFPGHARATRAPRLVEDPAPEDRGTASVSARAQDVAAPTEERTNEHLAGPGAVAWDEAGGPLVLVAELDAVEEFEDVLARARRLACPLLFVGSWRSLCYVGPWSQRGVPGCPRCLVVRTANSAFGPDLAGERVLPGSPRLLAATTLGPATLSVVARSVAEAVRAGPPTGTGAASGVLVLDGVTGAMDRRTLLPDSTCALCGQVTTDTVPHLTPNGVPLPKLGPEVLRTGQLSAEQVERDYLFPGLGLFKEVRQDLQSPFGACSVELDTRWGRREPAIGRARGYRTSRTVAVLEGLERYAGLRRGGRTAPVRASYAEVADRALCPLDLGTHPEESYRTESFPYREFHQDTVVDWVWAYSFQAQEPVLVPERAAFWGPRHDGEIAFVYDTSNGCALGNSVEEAVLHGLREVAERDSFLLTWYRRLALPEVCLEGERGAVGDLLRRAELFTGCRFRCFLSTMEYGMPSLWLTAEGPAGGPSVLAGSGAHPDPRQALVGGLHELVGIVLAVRDGFPDRREEAEAMLADADLVRRMSDHSLVNALPAARDRFAFLLDAPHEEIRLDAVPATLHPAESDLRVEVDTAVRGFLDAGLDVLVVDQTMPELRRNGLCCARVLVPGLVPMTFGHRNRRTRGLPRLTEGTGLPYPGAIAPEEEVGCVPHPFP